MQRRHALLALAAALAAAGPARAQEGFPSRTLTIVVPVAPGSSTDILARLIAERLGPRLGQTAIVENRPGASGLVGAGQVARAAPDGHTLALVPSTLFIAPHVLPRGAPGGLDVVTDFAPIVKTASSPMLLLAHPSLGVKTVPELVAAVKRAPGLAYATSGNGSPMHIAGEVLQHSTGIELNHVPYKGVMPAVQDTVAGQVKLAISALGGVTPFIQSGKVVPLGIVGARSALLPDVKTLAEQGITGIDLKGPWFPLLAPAGTPPAVIARLNREVNAILQLPEVRERLLAMGVEPLGGSSAEAEREVREEYARYGRVVKQFGIKGE
ncbi:tripartite tricarboxylate transporter substrate binding protein [Aquabacterium sp. J223]|uniref:Bug family tripartite tricarboxylate transporter substrate binding protein n=1 Tax=Aquabacterium sp. J223 TaxID=2898431 RepID=UPI0021AD9DD6|nr:tripartite tricarboxylate transporter substrate binding protein [Aquabacterium sp. J223]UUX95453.1 tripartite tricarboxylate transporter substrate binding protein [Aquabacterium sp. J223]